MRTILALSLLLLAAPAARAATSVAVLPVNATDQNIQKTADLLTDVITTEAGKRTDLKIIGSNELKNLVSFEQQKSLVGCTNDSCLAEIGAALGVDAILTGSIGQLGNRYVLNLQLLNARKADPLARATESTLDAGHFLELIPHMVGTLLAVFPGGSAPPPRPANTAAPAKDPSKATATTSTASTETPSSTPVAKGASEGGGGSSLIRRLAGVGVAGVGGVMLLGALAVGGVSLGCLYLVRSGKLKDAPGFLNYGIGGAADVMGVLAVAVVVAGIAVAAFP
jgi:TolB-like protein